MTFDPTKPVQMPRRWWVERVASGETRPPRAFSGMKHNHVCGCIEVIELTPAVREALQEKGLLT